ncbi:MULTISPECIES: GNAT family N-acetyltransferase [Prauserella salsuginis group]|uniref:GNAT family N-acetyltransferase n=1 Tax=Prauserella salsuginis TaxID=387889 RepID=A0ABW6GB77_9PSEU|nr:MULTISPECIES: GNAT family N-acetyltransferase [Prauserella salsuginis group]MCR3722460.1 Acetyltransferase (GNAT) domain-containing protein [Prauserella flava]MCR3736902.1 Acetyltransferase (GNAT) domain-containing protein [Prauserella salsuginis]
MSSTESEDQALLRQSVAGLGEALAALGRYGSDATEIRRANALGAVVPWADNHHWIDAAAVPVGTTTPSTGEHLPHCLWTSSGAPDGRREQPEVAMPAMARDLPEPETGSERNEAGTVGAAEFGEIGALNDLAYRQQALGPLLAAFPPEVGHGYGIRDHSGRLVSAAVALDVGSDTSVQWVVTHPDHRRQGLSARLLQVLLAEARGRGQRTATLQSSPDGFSLYQRLGFRTVGTLHAYVS